MSHRAFYLNTLWQYGLQLVKYILPLILMPYLTRALGVQAYAVYAYMVSFMGFAQTFMDFGFNLSGTKQIAAARTVEEKNEIYGSISQARFILSFITGIGCFAIGLLIPIVRENPVYASISFLGVCLRAFAPDFVFQGFEDMGPLTTRYLISKSLSVFMTILMVRGPEDLIWVALLDVAASFIALFWSYYVAKKRFNVIPVFVSWNRAINDLRDSAYYCATNMASSALSGVTTVVLGVAIVDQAQISFWSISMSAISAVQSLFTPIVNSLYPHMLNQKDMNFIKKLVLLSVPFIALGTAVFYVMADMVVAVVGGPDFSGAVSVLRLLTPIVPLSFYCMFFGWPVLGAMGYARELAISTISSSLCGVVALGIALIAGSSSILLFALIRDCVELLLCVSRLFCVRMVLRKRMNRKGN